MAVSAEMQAPPAEQYDITSLLETIQTSVSSAVSSLPLKEEKSSSDVSIQPPQDGISLLDTKNEIFLSYLHNMTFLALIQLRRMSSTSSDGDESLREEAVRKLVELRIYLDRGVKLLEGRLRYQIDKVIKAAEDAERARRGGQTGKSSNKAGKDEGSGEESSGDEGNSREEDSEEEAAGTNDGDIDEMAYRPNVSALSKGVEPQAKSRTTTAATTKAASDGIYRPPKIMPTALSSAEDRLERDERRKPKSSVIDEFVTSEMSTAPVAEASIGSAIRAGGRHTRTRREKEEEAERRMFEETHFMRLPKESKKERAKKRRGRGPEATFGGEEWRGLGEGADRISRVTRPSKGSGNVLERSRKRKPTGDGPLSDGASMGSIFEKRRKKIDSWKR